MPDGTIKLHLDAGAGPLQRWSEEGQQSHISSGTEEMHTATSDYDTDDCNLRGIEEAVEKHIFARVPNERLLVPDVNIRPRDDGPEITIGIKDERRSSPH